MENRIENIAAARRDHYFHPWVWQSTQVVSFPLLPCVMQKSSAVWNRLATTAAAPSASNSSRWQPKSISVRRVVIAIQFLLDWTISVCSLSTIAADTSFRIICHFYTYLFWRLMHGWNSIPWLLSCLKLLFWHQHPPPSRKLDSFFHRQRWWMNFFTSWPFKLLNLLFFWSASDWWESGAAICCQSGVNGRYGITNCSELQNIRTWNCKQGIFWNHNLCK